MKKDGYLSIGDMADICEVSRRTLRYYDSIGLISPACIGEDNGYRYYEPYQVGRIHLIKQMQDLGISLDDVATCVREKGTTVNLEEFFEQIKKRSISMEEELKTLVKQQQIIQGYLSQMNSICEKMTIMDQEIHITYYPVRYLISRSFTGQLNPQMFGPTFAEIGSSLKNQSSDEYSLFPQIGSYYIGQRNSDTCVNHIGFFSDTPREVPPFSLTTIDAGYYATYQVQGSYRDIVPHYATLFQYLSGLHYEPKGCCVEVYTISPGISLDEKKYITELQVAIRMNENIS